MGLVTSLAPAKITSTLLAKGFLPHVISSEAKPNRKIFYVLDRSMRVKISPLRPAKPVSGRDDMMVVTSLILKELNSPVT